MLKQEENEKITRTGAGTPMGELLRRYWIPALLANEMSEPDGAPVRVRLLGEDLVAFKNTSGKISLLDAYCPHRGVELFYGRNEECGLRCIYHGWKFDAEGNCVDMPNEPSKSNFQNKVKIKSYPCWEAGGVIWTYMGTESEMPPKPDYEWLRAPESHRFVSKTRVAFNWVQAFEGAIDTSHSSFLHNNDLADKNALRTRSPNPQLEVIKTPYGYDYAGIRDIGDGRHYVRAYNYIAPFLTARGNVVEWSKGGREKYPTIMLFICIPIDDENTFIYTPMYSADPMIAIPHEYAMEVEKLYGRHTEDMIPGSNFELKRNRSNDFMINREVQKKKTYSGVDGINTQDYALQNSMHGRRIADRTRERLGTSDSAVIAFRRVLLKALEDMGEGKELPGLDPSTYHDRRPYDKIIHEDVNWREGLKEDMETLF